MRHHRLQEATHTSRVRAAAHLRRLVEDHARVVQVAVLLIELGERDPERVHLACRLPIGANSVRLTAAPAAPLRGQWDDEARLCRGWEADGL